MAINDFTLTENRDSDTGEKASAQQTLPAQNLRASVIKNAHATGDGSYGRSDDSIPEEVEEDEAATDNRY